MKRKSAGILMYKRSGTDLLLLLVHPGGPYWARKDAGVWSIPKGEHEPGEDSLAVAKREFAEELGRAPGGEFRQLGELLQPSRKLVTAWAVEGDFDVSRLTSNMFRLEWPPGSGRVREFPEVDRAQWFTPDEARTKILPGQREFIDRLLAILEGAGPREEP